jgi:hypothetical protein
LRQLVADTLLNDVGVPVWVNRIGGKPVELIRYRLGVLTVAFNTDTGEPSYTIGARTLDPADVIDVRNLNERSPLYAAREAVALAIIMERHRAELFRTRPGRAVCCRSRATSTQTR